MTNTATPLDQAHQITAQPKAAPAAAPAMPRQALAPLTVAVRVTALVLAGMTTGLVLGSQWGLGLMYENEADAVLAMAQPAQHTVQLVATAN